MIDVRYYAKTLSGRQRIKANTDQGAIEEVMANRYLRATTREIVKETRTSIWFGNPTGKLVPGGTE